MLALSSSPEKVQTRTDVRALKRKERVIHAVYGPGTIRSIGRGNIAIQVVFESQLKALTVLASTLQRAHEQQGQASAEPEKSANA